MVCFDQHLMEMGWEKQTGSVKMPLAPLVACSFYFYLYIPVSYFALTV